MKGLEQRSVLTKLIFGVLQLSLWSWLGPAPLAVLPARWSLGRGAWVHLSLTENRGPFPAS